MNRLEDDIKSKLTNPELFSDKAFVAGTWVDAQQSSLKKVDVKNPATGEVLCSVPKLGIAEVKKAVEQAKIAQKLWANSLAKERGVVLKKLSEMITKNKRDLATIITLEQGKPLAEAESEIKSSAAYFDWFGEEARRVYGDTISSSIKNYRAMVIKQPVGVTAAITPWNFPSSMIARKLSAALAAGCAMLIKPSSETPLSALAYGKIIETLDLPKGLVSILTGDSKVIGQELTTNTVIKKLSFTGSTAVGKTLIAQTADSVKRLSLELGGNAPFIVFGDADIDSAVNGAILSKYRNNGQTCICANRIYVHASVYDEFLEKYTARVKNLVVGSGLDPKVTLGPLINADAVEKMEDHLKDGLQKGASIITGGKRHSLGGNYFEPTVLCDVNPKMKLAKEEIFGPLATISKFESEQEVVQLANDTEYGLSAFFYGRDIGLIWRVAEALEYGMIGVNTGSTTIVEAPFGGVKQSGFGKEGSKYGLDEYLNLKYVCFAGLDK